MLYELVLQSVYANQVCINRWNYVSESDPASVSRSFALIAAGGFIWDNIAVPPGYPVGTLFELMRALVVSAVSYTQVAAFAVYDPVDFYQTPFVQAAPGGAVGTGTSPAVAYGFRSSRTRRDIARGYKRVVGVAEESMGAGGVVTNPALSIANDLAVKMGATLTYVDEGNNVTFTPVIVSKQKYNPATQAPSDTGTAYRYYPTLEEQMEHVATGILWEPYPQVRTQRSRQYGHGI